MRQINLGSQGQNRSIDFDQLSTEAVMAILAIKPVEEYVQGSSALSVTQGSSSVSLSLSGPFLFDGDSLYSDSENRVVRKGKFASRLTDTSVHEKAKVLLLNAADKTPVQNSQGKELVAFLKVDVLDNSTSLEFHVDNGDGTYSPASVPAGVSSVMYQFLQRFSFDEVRPEVASSKKFFHGVVDLAVDNDLNQLLKDLYGPGAAFNGTGQASLNSGESVLERISDLYSELSVESNARQAADTGLLADIGTEASARIAADQQLQNEINNKSAALSGEISDLESELTAALSSVESALEAALDQEVSDRIADVNSEEARALAAEAALSASLAAEQSRAQAEEADIRVDFAAADAALQSSLNAESSRALAAESALSGAISALQVDSGSSLSGLQSALDAEETRALAAEAALQAAIDAEEVRALAAEGVLQSAVDSEEARALAAEAVLQAAVDAEEVRALAAEVVLQAAIDAEETRATLAEAALQSELDAEEVRALAAEAALQAEINAEEVRALAAEAALQSVLDAEEVRALAAESALQSELNAEETRALAAEAALQSSLNAEIARAQAEEADIRADFASADAAVLSSAEDYADQKIADLVNGAPALLDTLKEIADQLSDDQSVVTSLTNTVANNLVEAKAYTDTEVSAEETRALAAEAALQAALDAEEVRALAAEAALQSEVNAEEVRALAVEAALQAEIDAEEARALAAEAILDGRLDVLQGPASQSGSVAALIAEADDVLFEQNLASLPITGKDGVIYVTKNDNRIYRYVETQVPASYNHTVGSTGTFSTLEAALASPSVLDGHTIFVQAGTYTVSSTISITKQVKIYGAGKTQTVFQSAGTSSDPVSMVSVATNNVLLMNLGFKHKKSSNTSVETAVVVSGTGSPQTRVSGFIMDGCRIEHVEFGLTVRGSGWKIANTDFVYKGPNNSTRRHVGIYGVDGNCFAVNNTSNEDIAVGVTGNTRWFALTSTTGTNPSETYQGTLVLDGNVQSGGNLQQFYSQDAWQGTSGGFNLVVKNNVTNESSAFVSFYGTVANFGNIIGEVTVQGNTISNLHGGTPAGGKGLIGIDGAGGVAFRSSSLIVHHSGNTLSNLLFRTDYTEATGSSVSLVGRSIANIGSAVVELDSVSPAVPATPSTPSVSSTTQSEYVELSIQPDLSGIEGDIAAEEARALAAEAALQAAIDAEEVRALAAEAALQSEVNAEESRALAAEAALQAAVDAEEVRALAAEAVLQSEVNAEEVRALAAEAVLQSAIDAEEVRALAAEAVLQAAVDAEEVRALAAEVVLQNAIDAEEVRALAAEAALQSELDAEEVRALAAEAALQSELNAEEARALAAETALSGAISALSSNSSSSVSELQAELDAEEVRALAAEAALQSALDDEEARALAAEAALQAELDAEEATRASADSNLQSQVDSLMSALNAYKALVGKPVDMESVSFGSDGSYILQQAPSGIVPGSKPMLIINGVLQQISQDFSIVADTNGVMRKAQLVLGSSTVSELLGPDGTAAIWYRAVL